MFNVAYVSNDTLDSFRFCSLFSSFIRMLAFNKMSKKKTAQNIPT